MTTDPAQFLGEPAFRLRWFEGAGRYTVSKPNIGDTDCYTRDQCIAAVQRALAAQQQAPAAEAVQPVRTFTRADLLEAVETERHACSIAVWMTLQDALEPDADDKGLEGWMCEAESRVKNRLAHHKEPAAEAAKPPAQAVPATDSHPSSADSHLSDSHPSPVQAVQPEPTFHRRERVPFLSWIAPQLDETVGHVECGMQRAWAWAGWKQRALQAEAAQARAVRLTPAEMDAAWDEWFGAVGFQTQPGQATRRAFASAIERAVLAANGLRGE